MICYDFYQKFNRLTILEFPIQNISLYSWTFKRFLFRWTTFFLFVHTHFQKISWCFFCLTRGKSAPCDSLLTTDGFPCGSSVDALFTHLFLSLYGTPLDSHLYIFSLTNIIQYLSSTIVALFPQIQKIFLHNRCKRFCKLFEDITNNIISMTCSPLNAGNWYISEIMIFFLKQVSRATFHFQMTPAHLCHSLYWFPRSECWICSEEGTEDVYSLHMSWLNISISLELIKVRVHHITH